MTTYLFISDLHLSEQHPCLVQGFFALLQHYQSYHHVKLYILGDWFNAWLGDDVQNQWLNQIIEHLQQFTRLGHEIYFLVGNRDFLLGQDFLNHFQGKLLAENVLLKIAQKHIRIEHGDALCTDDVSYQRFKKIIRSPIILMLLKHSPLAFRQKLANKLRQNSQQSNQHKTLTIMDVNAGAVQQVMENVDILIHGHTHRPCIHNIEHKQRIVLGDWRERNVDTSIMVEAMILEINDDGLIDFKLWSYSA